MSDADPLDGADIGETVTVERRQRHHSINSAPSVFSGSDRDVDAEIVAINRIEVDGGFDDWEVVYRGEVTRTAPPYPERESNSDEQPGGTRPRVARLVHWASIAIGTAVAGVVGWVVLHGPASEIAQTPQPELTGPSWGLLDMLGLAVMAVLVLLSLKYAPGMAGGRR